MTREEARQFGLNLLHGIVERNKVSDPRYANNVKQAIDALSAPSLPSDLDEAAEKFVWEVMENDEDGISELSKKLRPTSKISDFYYALGAFFKAGAEYMAGQGETIECSVDWYNGPILDFSEEQLLNAITKAELEIGDKVVVQIRKK